MRMTKFLWYLSIVILGSVLLGYEGGVIKGKQEADRWYAVHPVVKVASVSRLPSGCTSIGNGQLRCFNNNDEWTPCQEKK